MEALSHPDRVAFLLSIAATPDDDTPRLVFADWLEEYGGDPAQAKYIRRAIAWAAERPEPFPWQPSSGSPLRKCPCPACGGFSVAVETCPTCGGTGDLFDGQCVTCGGHGDTNRGGPCPDCERGIAPRTVTFARGFPDSVECAAADVWREGVGASPSGGTAVPVTVPTEWAKAVVRCTPCVRFVVTDYPDNWTAGERESRAAAVGAWVRAAAYPAVPVG